MALRSKDSLYAESLIKGADRKMYAQCILMIQQFDENYIRSQMTQIQDRIMSYRDIDPETLVYNGSSDVVKAEINALKKKLKPFKLVLY